MGNVLITFHFPYCFMVWSLSFEKRMTELILHELFYDNKQKLEDNFFSTSVELEPDSVCVCVCVGVGVGVGVYALQGLGHSREGINCQTCLKIGTLITWVNHWGCFFHFLKILIFGSGVLVPGP